MASAEQIKALLKSRMESDEGRFFSVALLPEVPLGDMVLGQSLAQQLDRVVREQRHAARIIEQRLSHRSKLLLVGPLGTGKTMTRFGAGRRAEMIEQELSYGMVVAAANIPGIPDPALFRYDDVLYYDLPDGAHIAELLKARLARTAAQRLSWGRVVPSAIGESMPKRKEADYGRKQHR